eukprot:1067_1
MTSKQYTKLITADVIRKRRFGVEESSIITLNHLLSMMTYCNFDDIQNEFSKTYRKLNRNDKDIDVINRHKQFGNLGKYMFEAVNVFGDYPNSNDIFYHGVSQCLLFTSLHAQINGPLSTSSSIVVAMNFATNDGLIISLKDSGLMSSLKYFNCEWISDFGNEKERFFIGNPHRQIFTFVNIIHTLSGNEYKEWLLCFKLIQYIFSGWCEQNVSQHFYLNTNINYNKLSLKTSELLCADKSVPGYMIQLLKLYISTIKHVKISKHPRDILQRRWACNCMHSDTRFHQRDVLQCNKCGCHQSNQSDESSLNKLIYSFINRFGIHVDWAHNR